MKLRLVRVVYMLTPAFSWSNAGLAARKGRPASGSDLHYLLDSPTLGKRGLTASEISSKT